MAAADDLGLTWNDDDMRDTRAEDTILDHLTYDGTTDYDWQPEASADELCVAIDHASRVYQLLADDTAELTSLIARRVA